MSKLYPHQQALLDSARDTGGSLHSIRDDDACATCAHCVYQPGEQSSCTQGWPATPDADGYITACAQHQKPAPGPTPVYRRTHGLGYKCATCYAQPGEVPYL